MNRLIEHAKRELDLLGMRETAEDGPDKWMRDHLLHMVEEFSKEGHSGFSAQYAIYVLNKLLSFEPLSPLTGAEDEWGAASPDQNNRCTRVFRNPDGSAFMIDHYVFTDQEIGTYTCGESVLHGITFPFTPPKAVVLPYDHEEFIRRQAAGEPL